MLPISQGYLSEVIADVDAEISEVGETNNTDTLIFYVEEASKPDLTIKSFTINKRMPMVGDTVIFTAIIENIGEKYAESSIAAIKIGNERLPLQFEIPPLKPSETFTVKRYRVFTQEGTYECIAYADYLNKLYEENEKNNIKIINVDIISPPKPDMIIQSFTVNNTSPVVFEDTVIYSTVIQNIGSGKADTCRLAIRVGNEYTPLQFIVPPLDPGQTFLVKRYKIFTNPGTYKCIAYADYYDSLSEESEINNIDSLDLTVLPAPKPDYIIQSFTVNNSNPLAYVDTAIFTAIVENQGVATGDTSRLAIRVGAEYTPLQFIIPPLNPGQTFMVKRYKIFSTEGPYLCIAYADYYDSLNEESETNNTDSLDITVLPAPKPDYYIQSFTVNNSNPRAYADTAIFTAVVANQGTATGDTCTDDASTSSSDPKDTDIGFQSVPTVYAMGGATVDKNDANWQAFKATYDVTYNTNLHLVQSSADAYDVVYFYCYAIIKAGQTDLSNADLIAAELQGVSKTPGTVINVREFEKASKLIQSSTAIDYNGASGVIDFNAAGDVNAIYEIIK